jgi:hypothetical protein
VSFITGREMEAILSGDKIVLFIVFFIPGFISVKIWNQLIPGEKIDFSKSAFEVIAYSAINYAFFSWLIYLIHTDGFKGSHLTWYWILVVFVMFFMPIVWPFVFYKLYQSKWILRFIISPYKKPWDYIFSKRESYWVIVNLKDGTSIGGRYGESSFSSSAPSEEQIYLERVWEIDSEGKFVKPIEDSKGIIIMHGEISSIEFYK